MDSIKVIDLFRYPLGVSNLKQDIKELISSAHKGNKKIIEFDTSCFSGEYVTGDVSKDYLEHIESTRNNYTKEKQEIDEGLTDLTESQ